VRKKPKIPDVTLVASATKRTTRTSVGAMVDEMVDDFGNSDEAACVNTIAGTLKSGHTMVLTIIMRKAEPSASYDQIQEISWAAALLGDVVAHENAPPPTLN